MPKVNWLIEIIQIIHKPPFQRTLYEFIPYKYHEDKTNEKYQKRVQVSKRSPGRH